MTLPDFERFAGALQQFCVPTEDQLQSSSDTTDKIRRHPSRDIEAYFEYVTRVGKPGVPWSVIRPAFLWKLKFVMEEMQRLDREKAAVSNAGGDPESLISVADDPQFQEAYQFLLNKAEEFDAAPFTWQRICELLVSPFRHYKRSDKFLRAMDKNVNVVTTITESGARITGVDFIPSELPNGRIEQRFFGKVDEVDGMDDTPLNFSKDNVNLPNGTNGTTDSPQTEGETTTGTTVAVKEEEMDTSFPPTDVSCGDLATTAEPMATASDNATADACDDSFKAEPNAELSEGKENGEPMQE